MKKKILNIVASAAVITAFVSSVEAVDVSKRKWEPSTWFQPVTSGFSRLTGSQRSAVNSVNGFGVVPTNPAKYQRYTNRILKHYTGNDMTAGYRATYRAALIARGYDASYADRLTAQQINASIAAANVQHGIYQPAPPVQYGVYPPAPLVQQNAFAAGLAPQVIYQPSLGFDQDDVILSGFAGQTSGLEYLVQNELQNQVQNQEVKSDPGTENQDLQAGQHHVWEQVQPSQ